MAARAALRLGWASSQQQTGVPALVSERCDVRIGGGCGCRHVYVLFPVEYARGPEPEGTLSSIEEWCAEQYDEEARIFGWKVLDGPAPEADDLDPVTIVEHQASGAERVLETHTVGVGVCVPSDKD
jgi:hypothetical protein